MAPERKYPDMSKEEMISFIQKLAKEVGRSPSQADMRKAGVPWHRIYNQFGGMRQAVRAAGLEPGPRGEPLNEGAMILDWAGVVRKLRRLPSRAEYDRLGKHHSGTLHARLDWSQMAHRFVLMVRQFHVEEEWADVVGVVVKRFPLLKSTQQSAVSIQPLSSVDSFRDPAHHGGAETRREQDFTAENAEESLKGLSLIHGVPGQVNTDATDQSGARDISALSGEEAIASDRRPAWMKAMRLKRVVPAALAIQILMATASGAPAGVPQPQPARIARWRGASLPVPHEPSRTVAHESSNEPIGYGAPVGLAAMAHAPTNEAGVMFLFGVLAERLRFRIERMQTAFPDCEAKREVRPGVWELRKLELEFESRNFKEHGHDPKGCHGIVCWRHNWPECPRGLEVIELCRYVG